jgi:predicted phosphodiesterase
MVSGRIFAADERTGDEFTFGVIADAQYCDAETAGARHYRASLRKLAECVDALNQRDLAFAIHLGDFIDRDFASFAKIAPIYNRLQMPRYHVLGNHEFSVADNRKPDVPEALGLDHRYYMFRVHGWRFLVLDGNDLSIVARREVDPEYRRSKQMYDTLVGQKKANAQVWNGAIGREQVDWLDTQLSATESAGERAVVFCHFPVYPPDKHNLWNDTEVVQLLERHRCVAAWMNGHNHAGNYAVKNGIHYVTFPGLVETADTTAYALVRVRPTHLEIKGFGRTPGRVLELR